MKPSEAIITMAVGVAAYRPLRAEWVDILSYEERGLDQENRWAFEDACAEEIGFCITDPTWKASLYDGLWEHMGQPCPTGRDLEFLLEEVVSSLWLIPKLA